MEALKNPFSTMCVQSAANSSGLPSRRGLDKNWICPAAASRPVTSRMGVSKPLLAVSDSRRQRNVGLPFEGSCGGHFGYCCVTRFSIRYTNVVAP